MVVYSSPSSPKEVGELEQCYSHYLTSIYIKTNAFVFCTQLLPYYFPFVIFKPLSYFFKETIGFDVKVSFASRSVLCLIRWYNKPGEITKEFWKKTIQFHRTFHGLCKFENLPTCSNSYKNNILKILHSQS